MRKSVFPTHVAARASVLQLIFVFLFNCSLGSTQNPPGAPGPQKAQPQKTEKAEPSEAKWPRTITSGADTFLIYEPQVETWEENRIHLYSAVELKTGTKAASKYGVVWFSARTEVDKVNRLVTLEQPQLTTVKFPGAPDKEDQLTALLQKILPGATRTISLDRLQAALLAAGAAVKKVEVKNTPPRVIIATQPSLLVLIDGLEQLRDVPETQLQRVINTRAILLFDRVDALFGKRREVTDSLDRYANIDISYLLQRMEAYRALAILTSSMTSPCDPAFLRRIRFVVQFPSPDAAHRAEI